MKELYRDDGYRLLEYNPSLLKPLYKNFEPMGMVRRIRFLLEYLGRNHYRVFYLEKDGDLIGHCVVAPGGRRLKCSTSDDIVLGPYYIRKEERGRGYSVKLIGMVLENTDYRYAFDWVEKKNIASCKASERCGFTKIGELNVSPFLRKLTIVEEGDDIIYRQCNQKHQELSCNL